MKEYNSEFFRQQVYYFTNKTHEWLQESGEHFTEKSLSMKKKAPRRFEAISDAGTGIFITKLDEMSRIYNYTRAICFDRERVYLVEG